MLFSALPKPSMSSNAMSSKAGVKNSFPIKNPNFLVKNQNVGQKSKSWSKIKKSWSEIKILAKNQSSGQK